MAELKVVPISTEDPQVEKLQALEEAAQFIKDFPGSDMIVAIKLPERYGDALVLWRDDSMSYIKALGLGRMIQIHLESDYDLTDEEG